MSHHRDQRFSISVAEIFYATLAVALIAFCVGRMGSRNPYVWGCLALTLAFGGIVSGLYCFQRYAFAAIAASAITVLALALIPSMVTPTLMNAGVTIPVLVLFWLVRHQPRRFAWCMVWTTVLSFGWSSNYFDAHTLARLHATREAYPIVSLEPRLAYLKIPASDSRGKLSPSVEIRLRVEEQLVSNREYLGRREAFESLHNQYLERFIQSNGFGVFRMVPTPSKRSLNDGPLREFPFDDKSDWYWDPEGEDGPTSDQDRWMHFTEYNAIREFPRDYHSVAVRDFIHPDSFGWVFDRERKQVSGFMPHGFHNLPPHTRSLAPSPPPEIHDHAQDDDHDRRDPEPPTLWDTQSLQLISLHRFDQPRVYVLEQLPRMDKLASQDIETRELNEFEQSSLSRLYFEKDVVLQQSAEHAEMVGAIRAQELCLDCHTAQRGDLLGAFTYSFRSTPTL